MKTLLLDIDYTLMDSLTPRPHLKEFIEEMDKKYKIHFYTAANRMRITEVLRIFNFGLGMDRDLIRRLQMSALTRENCPMVKLKKDNSGEVEIKSLDEAAKILGVPVEDIILLDDNPSYDNPRANQVVQAEGFMAYMENDDYLTRTGL